jgi:hypothetical protein
MFDIDTRIQEWRRTVLAHFGDRGDVVDELEAHLRDDLDRRLRSGVAPEQAWADACAQLGEARQLAGEFAKVSGGRPWLPAWIAAIAVIAAGLSAAAWVAIGLGSGESGGRRGPLLASHVVTIAAGYATVLAVGGLSIWSLLARARARAGWWDGRRALAFRRAVLMFSAVGLPLTAVGVALGAVWARDHLGRYWGWDLREIGGLAVLTSSGLSLWAARSGGRFRATGGPQAAGAVMLAGIAGNIIVSLSWFGPRLVEAGHRGGTPRYGPYLVAFVAVQVVLLAFVAAAATMRRMRETSRVR